MSSVELAEKRKEDDKLQQQLKQLKDELADVDDQNHKIKREKDRLEDMCVGHPLTARHYPDIQKYPYILLILVWLLELQDARGCG